MAFNDREYHEFYNRNIIVTGASSGIGKAVAIALSELGAKVHLIARNGELLDVVNREICNRGFVYQYDLSNISCIEGIVDAIVEQHGSIDGFVHCAGIGGARPLKLLHKSDIEKFMNINFYAFIEFSRCLSRKGCYGNNLSIIAMSSIASVMGDKGKIAYCSSKAALDASVRCLAKELASKKIRVNTIRASWVNTKLYSNYIKNWGDNEVSKTLINRHYLGILDTDDICNMVIFLLSIKSKRITGSAVLIDSGSMA